MSRSSSTPLGSEKRIRDTLDFHISNSPLAVVEWDQQFRVCFWSGRAEHLFGWSEAELLGKHPSDWRFVHEDDAASVDEVMAELLSSEAPRNISSNRNYTRDGKILYCEWYNSILTDDDGQLVSVLSLIHDLTERNQMEEQLRQLQKMESIGQLTGGIAHDFNNLLTVILGNSDQLADALDQQPELRQTAEVIIRAAQRGAELTHQLLAFARQQTLEPQALDLSQMLAAMQNLLKRTLGEQIDLRCNLAEDLWLTEIDATQLESAILNLCINARDALPNGGLLTIEAVNCELDEDYASQFPEVMAGEYVQVAISDNGLGMTPDVVAQVFEPFFTTKERNKGTGLGLSMVHGFVKQSCGHIRIYSEPGSGTTVRLYLPRSLDARVDSTPAVSPSAIVGGNERILVVEDNRMVRDFAVVQLKLLGYAVHQAGDAQQALEVLDHHGPFDLLFSDVVMPGGVYGPDLARLAVQKQPSLRVLLTSGYTERALDSNGRLDGKFRLLSKPYERATLASEIRELLDKPPG